MAPMIGYEKWRDQQMQDPEFTAELEKLEPGYQVARLRIKLGLTQAQLAEIVGTKQPSIARLESGATSPSLSFLEKVAAALGAEMRVNLIPKTPAHELRESSSASIYKTENNDQLSRSSKPEKNP